MSISKVVLSCNEETTIRRRWIPIKLRINEHGELLQFEKKLPYKTCRVVGVRTVITQEQKNSTPIDIGVIGIEETEPS